MTNQLILRKKEKRKYEILFCNKYRYEKLDLCEDQKVTKKDLTTMNDQKF